MKEKDKNIFIGMLLLTSVLCLGLVSSAQVYGSSNFIMGNYSRVLNLGTQNPLGFTAQTYNQTWLNFDGNNRFINITNKSIIPSSSEFTVSIWENATYTNTGYLIADAQTSYASNFLIRRYDSTQLSFNLQGASFPMYLINFGYWHNHVMVYYGNGTLNMYTDGVLRQTNSSPKFLGINSSSVMIGNRNDLDRDYNGSIDNVQIFNIALNQDQVLDLYMGGRNGKYEYAW